MTKRKPDPDIYAAKRACLAEYEVLSEQNAIDVFYGDESGVSLQPNVPYAWQYKDAPVTSPSERGGYLNCFALLARDNRCFARTTEGKVTAEWIAEQIDEFAKTIKGLTVVVLDNARIHTKAVKDHAARWQEKGLFVLFLPPRYFAGQKPVFTASEHCRTLVTAAQISLAQSP